GCTGSAPIQNIGAYGVELKDVCEYVDIVHLPEGNISRLSAQTCQFGYRDSIFKHQYQSGYAIVAVGLILKKQWSPVITYGDLSQLSPATVTPVQVFDAVCAMRSSKLPNPAETGNAGSFFKNPVVAAEQAAVIAAAWPDMPRYPQADGSVKLAAGWLIDRCDLKGYNVGGAAVHQNQALVLINKNRATSDDIVALAHEVRQRVGQKFNVWLEPEVRFIGAEGEQDAVGVIA
ncbi:MAG TPA: UDP-N-acetylenolpyruvoylglucosamine reductase, partial [Erwinia sp.]|nr:UDP-N-acetylenolpyruvoylglucosamine reductase [Erwinia sp.]